VLSVLYKEACDTPSLFKRTGVDPFQPLNRFARTALEERLSAVIALVPDACREEEQVHSTGCGLQSNGCDTVWKF
jgi:hypothetical protein